jgi:hypothetical protein
MKVFYALFATVASLLLFTGAEAACPASHQTCPGECAISARVVKGAIVTVCDCRGQGGTRYVVCKPYCPVSHQTCPGECALSRDEHNVETCACRGSTFTVCKP